MLSAEFSLDEFIFNQTAARSRIDNTPEAATLRHLKHLAEQPEIVRDALGKVPILVSSGYRSATLNRAVKGSKNSAHLTGHWPGARLHRTPFARSRGASRVVVVHRGRAVHRRFAQRGLSRLGAADR